jgi:DNA-binding beta-propeller fold protein YncE
MSFSYDARMFVNVTGKDAVEVIDREKRTVIATWPIAQEAKHNVAMAFDEAGHRLFISASNPAKLIVLNSDSGAIVASLPCVHMVDDMSYDPKSKRLYLADSDFVDVFEQKDADHYEQIGHVIIDFFRSAQFGGDSASVVASDKPGLGKTACRYRMT